MVEAKVTVDTPPAARASGRRLTRFIYKKAVQYPYKYHKEKKGSKLCGHFMNV
jgi:hypothetical protein